MISLDTIRWWRWRWRPSTRPHARTGCSHSCSNAGRFPSRTGRHTSRGYWFILCKSKSNYSRDLREPNDKLIWFQSLPLADLRSCKQRQRYFSFFCNRRIMAAWSVQSNSSRSYLYSCSSVIFVIHHYDYPHKLYINDNAVITNSRVNRVSFFPPSSDYFLEKLLAKSFFGKLIKLLDEFFPFNSYIDR